MILRLLLALTLIPSLSFCADGLAERWSLEQYTHFTITNSRDGKYRATVNASTILRCMNPGESTSRRPIFIPEPDFAPVSKLSVSLNNVDVNKKHIGSWSTRSDDVFLSDDLFYAISIPGQNKAQDVVNYKYQQEYEDLGRLSMLRIENTDSLAGFVATFKTPSHVRVEPLILFARDEIVIDRDTLDGHLVLRAEPFGHLDHLPYYPFNDVRAIILPQLYSHDTLISPTSPESFMAWYSRNLNLRPVLDSTVNPAILDTVAQLPTTLAKLEALHDWVRHNIRYIADSRREHDIYPHAPESVLAMGYGDCKDRAYLISALANRLGIRLHMGLVSVDDDLPMPAVHPWLYEHVICYYEDSATSRFFDPTVRYFPFQDLPDGIVGQEALILDPEHPRTVVIPANDSLPVLAIAIDAHVDSLRQASALVTLRGDLLALIRYTQAEQTRQPGEDIIVKSIEERLAKVGLGKREIIEDQPRQMTLRYAADLSRFLIQSPMAIYLPRTPFHLADSDLLKRAGDTLPVYFEQSANYEASLTLRGAKTEKTDAMQFGNELTGTAAAAIVTGPAGEIMCSYQLRLIPRVFRGEAKWQLLDFYRQYLAANKDLFIVQGD